MEDDTVTKLLDFLLPSSRGDLKGIALEYLLCMSGSEEGCAYISQRSGLLEAILGLMFDDNAAIRKEVQKCMINLTADEKVVRALLGLECSLKLKEVTLLLLQQCLDAQQTNTMVCSILTNMTRVAECAAFVADVMLESQSLGLASFVDTLCYLLANKGATLTAVSTLLMNLTQVSSVRQGLMAPPARLLLRLLPFISMSPSLTSCKGIVGVVKNCCFEIEFHEWLLSEEVDLLPRILLPLAGPEEFTEDEMEQLPPDLQYLPDTKQREADPEVRGMLVQAVYKLCQTDAGRLHMKQNNAYIILRELLTWETCEENIESIRDVQDLLVDAEPQEALEEIPPGWYSGIAVTD